MRKSGFYPEALNNNGALVRCLSEDRPNLYIVIPSMAHGDTFNVIVGLGIVLTIWDKTGPTNLVIN